MAGEKQLTEWQEEAGKDRDRGREGGGENRGEGHGGKERCNL